MSVAAIEKVVARLRWRLRAQTALRHGLLLGAIGLIVFALLVVLVKTRLLASDWVWVGGAIALALPAIGVAIGVLSRFGDIALAASLDAAGGLHSRLGSALSFARLPTRTPMQEAAMEDAVQVIGKARPASASPWRWGAFAVGAGAFALSFAVSGPALFVFELPVAAMSGQTLAKLVVPPHFKEDKAEVRKDDEKRLEDLAKDLDEELKVAADPAVKQFLADLNELIRALQEGRITPEEAHARMAELEKAMNEWKQDNATNADEVETKLQEAAAKQKKPHEEVTPLIDAMKEKDWKSAAEALEKLAAKMNEKGKELSDADKKKIAKDVEQLAKDIENERQKQKERLEKERDRLEEKQKKEKDRFAKKDKDRLQDTQRQLEQLDDPKQQRAQSEPERQLERLSEELDDAARDMLRRLAEEAQKMGGEQGEQGAESEQRREQPAQEGQEGQDGQDGQGMTSEDMKRAAEALRKMAQGGQGRQQMRIAQGRMVDVREMMRRGQGGKDGQGKDGQGKGGEQQAGKGGQPGGEGDAEQQFEKDAAGGKDGEGKDIMLGGDKPGGKPGDMLLLGGKGQGGMKIPGMGKNGQGGDPKLGQGDGYGDGHDKELFGGEKPSMDFDTKEDFVAGQHGDGPSKSKVVMTAAQKGFATAGYREVHQDYADVVEDALEKEHIPPGKRTYVRRYFDLIRPR